MVKVFEKVLEQDEKDKKLFLKKAEYLKEKKQKALDHRRSTINRKRKRQSCSSPSRAPCKSKRTKAE